MENVLANNFEKKKFNKLSERIREKSRSYINIITVKGQGKDKKTEEVKQDEEKQENKIGKTDNIQK